MYESQTQTDARTEKDPRAKQDELTVSMQSNVENAGAMVTEVARTQEGHELRADVNREIQGKVDYSARAEVEYDVGADDQIPEPYARGSKVAELRRPGQTLAAQERKRGEQREMKRHEKNAMDAYIRGTGRAKMSRRCAKERSKQNRAEWDERAKLANRRFHDEPQAKLSQDELAKVNQVALRLSTQFERVTRADIGKDLAHHMVEGDSGLLAASLKVRKRLEDRHVTMRSVENLDPYEDDDVRVQATVKTLFDPAAPSQYQVGILKDGDATVKFTVWQTSKWANTLGIPDLSVGDKVEITGARVNGYNGNPTLAADRDTYVQILEAGDGETVVNKTCEGASRNDLRLAPWNVDTKQHEWANQRDGVTPRLPSAAQGQIRDEG